MLKHKHTIPPSQKSNISIDHSSHRSRSPQGSEKKLNQNQVPIHHHPPVASKINEEGSIVLPKRFVVKYLGVRETTNLWGIQYVRDPIDTLVAEAKQFLSSQTSGNTLPLLKLEVTDTGVILEAMPQNQNSDYPVGKFPIESISYGVQDLIYTRVFAMIIVQSQNSKIKLSEISKSNSSPFECHAFVTDTKNNAKNLTLALAQAFQEFSNRVTLEKKVSTNEKRTKDPPVPPAVAIIDLRAEDVKSGSMDSEA